MTTAHDIDIYAMMDTVQYMSAGQKLAMFHTLVESLLQAPGTHESKEQILLRIITDKRSALSSC